jgi:uncharacterized protein YbdZ (MbtH family)
MNTGNKVLVEPNVAHLLDPYSTPRTIPGGWDVSAMAVKQKMSANKNPAVEPNVAKLLDPYGNPRTIPGGWDVSAITSPEKMTTDGDASFQSNLSAAEKNESTTNTL